MTCSLSPEPVVRVRRVVLLLALSGGCGARSELDGRALPLGQGGTSVATGGAAARGGTSSAGSGSFAGSGTSMGGAGMPTGGRAQAGGAGLPSAGRGGSGVGGSGVAGEPSGGEAGAGGSGAVEPPVVTSVAAGAFHSCVVLSDGSVRCWGSGGYIGSGNTVTIGDDETPASIEAVKLGGSAQQISASWYHTCVTLPQGKLRCFGNGANGKLGYGNIENIGDNEAPASAGDVAVGGSVESVSAGPYHTCAVLNQGLVRCWGQNDHSQLGYASGATIGDDELPKSVPTVDVGAPVRQVAAGFAHTCALTNTGTVRCWGSNSAGQLGYPGVSRVGDDETPASVGDVDVGGAVTQIVVGMLHTCALLDTGKVRCWGAGTDGRLGYANLKAIGDDETPASAGDVDVGGRVVQLSAGDYATCALLEGGKVRCWGSQMEGELGHPGADNLGDDETPASAGDINVGGVVASIDVGFLHVCAALESGAVRCWGRGATGALGYGSPQNIGDDETPASAGDVPLLPP